MTKTTLRENYYTPWLNSMIDGKFLGSELFASSVRGGLAGHMISGKVIAWGWYRDEPTEMFSVMMFMDSTFNRKPDNYAVFNLSDGVVSHIQYFGNIVRAANAYADEYGMDI